MFSTSWSVMLYRISGFIVSVFCQKAAWLPLLWCHTAAHVCFYFCICLFLVSLDDDRMTFMFLASMIFYDHLARIIATAVWFILWCCLYKQTKCKGLVIFKGFLAAILFIMLRHGNLGVMTVFETNLALMLWNSPDLSLTVSRWVFCPRKCGHWIDDLFFFLFVQVF